MSLLMPPLDLVFQCLFQSMIFFFYKSEGSSESHSLLLQPQVDSYLFILVIYQFKKSSCDHFQFEFLIETADTVQNKYVISWFHSN